MSSNMPSHSNQSETDEEWESATDVSPEVTDTEIENPEAPSSTGVARATKPKGKAPIPKPDALREKRKHDIAGFRLRQDLIDEVQAMVDKTKPKVQRPAPGTWFRVHPGAEFVGAFRILNDNGTFWLVYPGVGVPVKEMIYHAALYLCESLAGVLTLWPVKVVEPGEELNDWPASAHRIAEVAKMKAVRVFSNHEAGSYSCRESPKRYPALVPPNESYEELVERAFGERIIDSDDHPKIRKLIES
jgi:hypothetical protein